MTTPLNVRILIADDHPVVLRGLRNVLNARPDLEVVAEAHTNDEIADLLHISKKTVERHRANVLEKLGMRDRVGLTRYAIRRGLVEL